MHSDEFRVFLRAVLPGMGFNWRRFDRRNIRRKVRLRMESLGIHEAARYMELVNRDPAELAALNTLLRVTITRFFRNGWLWKEMSDLIQPFLLQNDHFRAWSAGCAGGEEPFSLAMLLDDLVRKGFFEGTWQVIGSDVDQSSLQRARKTSYLKGSVRELPSRLLERWFVQEDGQWNMDDRVRQMVTFMDHDILNEEPPGRFNLVLLRNSVLTYNTEPVQREVLEKIRKCLDPPGLLVIGRTEKMPEGTGFREVSRCVYKSVQNSRFKIQKKEKEQNRMSADSP